MSAATPDAAARVLQSAKEAFGFVPNLIKEMCDHNPAVAQLYMAAMSSLEGGVLSPAEREGVVLTVSRYNDCHYCTKAHAASCVAAGVSPEDVNAINSGGLPGNERLRNLAQATRLLLDKRGWLDEEDWAMLRAKGITRAELYDIAAIAGIKSISNYINHVASTDVDQPILDTLYQQGVAGEEA
jgi:uncharacterized peroxidase-related enzyme